MAENNRETFLHDWVVEEIQRKYSKEFNEIKINTTNKKDHPYGWSQVQIIAI